MNVTNLGGHSGCRILLCEDEDNHVYVRKISSSHAYNRRLEAQVEKQSSFCGREIRTPRIIQTGFTEQSLFYFDMDYIQGITLAEYIKTIEIGRIRGLVETIVGNILSSKEREGVADEVVFRHKLQELGCKLQGLKNPQVDGALELLNSHSWRYFKRSECHGDLSLQNIIVKDNQLYFIDFLDSFYDCWLLDVGTMMQDVQTMWAYRNQEECDVNTLIRLIVFRDTLLDEVCKIEKMAVEEIYYALLLKLIRIYPYVKDEKTYCFLNTKVKETTERLKKGEKTE